MSLYRSLTYDRRLRLCLRYYRNGPNSALKIPSTIINSLGEIDFPLIPLIKTKLLQLRAEKGDNTRQEG